MSNSEFPSKGVLATWWFWIIAMLILAGMILGVFGYVSSVSNTYVERKVFEQSYQRSEGLKQQVATIEAQLAEVSARLSDPDLEPQVRSNLEAQAASLRVQLQATKARQ